MVVFSIPLLPSASYKFLFSYFGVTAPQWARTSSFTIFLDHTQRRNPFGTTPLDE